VTARTKGFHVATGVLITQAIFGHRSGARCYLVMCEAKDIDASPRAIKSFNDQDLFVGGELREMDGDLWIERAGRVPARELMVQR